MVKDWIIIKVRNNSNTSLINKILYYIIWNGSRSRFNHCQLVREFNNELYICESTINGFNITKTYKKWLDEDVYLKRECEYVNLNTFDQSKFDQILGNSYDAKYWHYLINFFLKWLLNKDIWLSSKTDITSTNCWQSIAYIFNIKDFYKATGNSIF